MATLKQQKLAKGIVDNLAAKHPKTKQELVSEAGYSDLTADRASKDIIESDGVKETLVSFGFDPETAKGVVAEILIGGENDTVKLKAADMIFKVHDTYAPEKHDLTSKGDKIMTGESEIALLAKQAAQMLKEHDTDPTTTSSS